MHENSKHVWHIYAIIILLDSGYMAIGVCAVQTCQGMEMENPTGFLVQHASYEFVFV